MRRVLSLLLVLLFLSPYAVSAQTTFTAAVKAHFGLPCSSTSPLYNLPYDDPSACRLIPSEQSATYLSTPVSIAWGVGVYGVSFSSKLTFDPYDTVTLNLLSDSNVAGAAKAIGLLTHNNYPINCYDDCAKYIPTNFILGLLVNVQVGTEKATYKGEFKMFLDETPNLDGRNPITAPCPYPANEISWTTFLPPNGYTSSYPCCPYYTAKSVPDGAISLNGPCSDRLSFTTTSDLGEFIIGGTKYTLVIAGFASNADTFDTKVTFFTSQENQAQQAYVFAYITRKCTDASACNDGKSCTTNTCGSDGLCTFPAVTDGQACTDPPSGYYVDVCRKWKCVGGTCKGSSLPNDGSCVGTIQYGVGNKYTADCAKRLCRNGVCSFVTLAEATVCTSAATPSDAFCQRRICRSGSCHLGSANTGNTCTSVTATQSAAITAVPSCNSAKCISTGSCRFSVTTGGSCTGPTATTCNRRLCKTEVVSGVTVGTCLGTATTYTGSCYGNNLPAAQLCRRRLCAAVNGQGTCRVSSTNEGGSCISGNGALAGTADCKKRVCQSGTCVLLANPDQGSCTSITRAECLARKCLNGACSNVVDSAMLGSCSSITPNPECNKRACNGKGTCKNTPTSGSCFSLSAQECKKRTCSGGTCGTAANSGGSCTSLTAVECKKRSCSTSGACAYTATTGSCTSLTAVECKKRSCTSGACAYATTTGSCTSLTAVECKKRSCTSGVCAYAVATGSCTLVGSRKACYKRACSTTGTCEYSTNDQGSCLVTSTGVAVGVRSCLIRKCLTGSCVYQSAPSGGSCTSTWVSDTETLVPSLFCNQRKCDSSGVCQYFANTADTTNSGSCQSLSWKECNKRSCLSKSASPPGSCGYVAVGGSCVGAFTDSSSYNGLSAMCSRRICSSGACTLALIAGTGSCRTGKTSNDYSCFKERCRSKNNGVNTAGTCSTSIASTTKSCTAGATLSDTQCRRARCTTTGNCAYDYSVFTGSVSCPTLLTAKICAPRRCDGSGNCVYRSDLKEGQGNCLKVSDSASQTCITSQCVSGTCRDISDLGWNATTICKSSGPGEDSCKNYYCTYRNPSSNLNKLGTCVRLTDPEKRDKQCTTSAYGTASEEDARCFTLLCDINGVCQKFNRTDGTYCATPPNTQTNNGYGCSQYVCQSGTCNTGAAQPIKNGTTCAGAIPCDPATPGCLSECQRFICFNGLCQVDYFKENQNCTYIKYLTARDGSVEQIEETEEQARDSESGGVTANECTHGKCYQGRCVAQTVANGTACGNRTKYNDLCYGDYCNAQGQCVHTGRRNCQGVLPLPSVCWDVTCEASSGDCVLRANGVVDCSCIFDCSACTAKLSSQGRKLACWWCTGSGTEHPAGCFNRKLPGQTGEDTPPPTGHGKCYKDSSPCAGDNGLTGGQVAGIVVGILGLTSLALLVIALLILAIRYFSAAGTPPANASLTDLAFDKNVKNNVFYKGANLEMFSSVYAEPKFITT